MKVNIIWILQFVAGFKFTNQVWFADIAQKAAKNKHGNVSKLYGHKYLYQEVAFFPRLMFHANLQIK